jgi:hypothetical protein
MALARTGGGSNVKVSFPFVGSDRRSRDDPRPLEPDVADAQGDPADGCWFYLPVSGGRGTLTAVLSRFLPVT